MRNDKDSNERGGKTKRVNREACEGYTFVVFGSLDGKTMCLCGCAPLALL